MIFFGQNKRGMKVFSSIEGNTWRGFSPSAESIGEFFGFVILFYLIYLIDKKGKPVCDAWLWLDSRSSDIVKKLSKLNSEKLRFDLTGTGIFAGQQSSQISYMDKNNPEILDQSSTAFHCKDWIYFKLTNVRATDPSEACFTFGNFRTRQYDENVIDGLGLSKRKNLLPDIIDLITVGINFSSPCLGP